MKLGKLPTLPVAPSQQTTGNEDPSDIEITQSAHDSINTTNHLHLEILGNLTNEPLERKFTNQQLRRLLVTTDFSECNRS